MLCVLWVGVFLILFSGSLGLGSANPHEDTGAIGAIKAGQLTGNRDGPASDQAMAGLLEKIKRRSEMDLRFEVNRGQAAPEVKFDCRGDGFTLFLTASEAVLSVQRIREKAGAKRQKGRVPKNRSPRGNPDALPRLDLPTSSEDYAHSERRPLDPEERSPVALRMRFLGANPSPRIDGIEELRGKSHYLIGNDPEQWHTNVPSYAKVRYRNVYPGIDLIFYGNPRRLEYDFVVTPGADLSSIRLEITGEDLRRPDGSAGKQKQGERSRLYVGHRGDLIVQLAGGDQLRFKKPVVYQTDSGVRVRDSGFTRKSLPGPESRSPNSGPMQHPSGRYVLISTHEVGFAVSPYDRSRPLILDPILAYSTYLGGSGLDSGTAIAVDSSGNVYVAGTTNSLDFPRANAFQNAIGPGACGEPPNTYPCYDAFVTKIDAAGSGLIYSTYLGGNREDFGTKIAVDSFGSAYVTGYTSSTNFPIAGALQPTYGGGSCGPSAHPIPCFDAFVAKLKPDGSGLVYSTYLGGAGDDYAFGIALDSSGSAYVTGFTSSANFPTTSGVFMPSTRGGAYDGFVAKLNPAGSALLYSTYLGGSRDDFARGIAVDASGDAVVAGYTNSSNFPVLNAYQPTYHGGTCGSPPNTIPCFEAFVTKLNASGSTPLYSTYLGGSRGDYAYGLALDASGSAYITGYTVSPDFPITTGHGHPTGSTYDVYVAKLNPEGSSLVYSTHLGAPQAEVAYGIAVSSAGNAYLTGYAYGDGFPTANPVQPLNAGFYDAFVAELNAEGTALMFSSYLGGRGNEEGHDIAVDAAGNAYVTGSTFSTDFPVTTGASQRAYGGGSFDAFVTKIAGLSSNAAIDFSTRSLAFADQGVGTTSAAQILAVTNTGAVPLDIASIALAGDFVQTNTCVSSLSGPLAVGATCTVRLTFAPRALGSRSGTLTLNDSAPGSPHTVALSGNGVVAYSLAASTGSVTVVRGVDSATLTLSASSPFGFSGSVNLTCASGGPVRCAFNPAAISAGQSSTLTLTNLTALPGNPLSLTLQGASGSQTASVILSVAASDFSLTLSPGSATVTAGQATAYALTLIPSNGFSQQVSLNCGSAPAASSCSISPGAVSLDGTSPSTATVTVTTTARSAAAHRFVPPGADGRVPLGFYLWPLWHSSWLAWATLIAGMMVTKKRRASVAQTSFEGLRHFQFLSFLIAHRAGLTNKSLKSRGPLRQVRATLALCFAACCFMVSCGGGTTSRPPGNPGTPPGTYTLTLTATLAGSSPPGPGGPLSHAATVTLVVN